MGRISRTARVVGLAAAIVGATAGTAGTAGAGGYEAVRQHISFKFAERTPGVPSRVALAIDYVNPNDKDAKPYAVERLVESLAPGARFDTSVPERCTASDAELMAEGAAACPAGSRVGSGELDLDTGLPGPGRIIKNKVTELNNENELILLVEQEFGTRAVARSKIEKGALYAEAPPLPGGPPDGYTAIKRVRVELKRITRNGRGYVTTPPTCPASGRWINRIAFTYRDGVGQTATSASPCSRDVNDTTAPIIAVRGVPKECVSRAFMVNISVVDAGRATTTVTLDGRKLRTTTAGRFRVRIRAGHLEAGSHRLNLTARDRAGNRTRRGVTFQRCSPGPGNSDDGEDNDPA